MTKQLIGNQLADKRKLRCLNVLKKRLLLHEGFKSINLLVPTADKTTISIVCMMGNR